MALEVAQATGDPLGLVATQRALEAIRAEPARLERDVGVAILLNNLSIRLSALGRRERALEAIDERSRSAASSHGTHPDSFLPDLAMSLSNLSLALSELGRGDGALEAIDEAIRLVTRASAAVPPRPGWDHPCPGSTPPPARR